MATLQLIEEFLNTVDERTFSRHGQTHVPGDALAHWLAEHDLAGVADLEVARDLRTALRQALTDGTAALDGYPLRLVSDPAGGLRLAAGTGKPWLDTILETVAQSVARDDWKRLKLCAAPDCRWAFYDTSRNGRGRWCEMAVCGNRHKTRTYRERRNDS